MSEIEPTIPSEKCINCPHRGKISKLLAQLAGAEALAPLCEGPVSVAHGVIETQLRYNTEPSPKKSEFNWSSVTGSAGNSSRLRRYSKMSWTTENVCGRETIEPREGEVPYDLSETIWTNQDGTRYAAFIKGDEEQISDHRNMQAVMALLDHTSRLQAEDATEDEKDAASQDIAAMGFTILGSAGRGTYSDEETK